MRRFMDHNRNDWDRLFENTIKQRRDEERSNLCSDMLWDYNTGEYTESSKKAIVAYAVFDALDVMVDVDYHTRQNQLEIETLKQENYDLHSKVNTLEGMLFTLKDEITKLKEGK